MSLTVDPVALRVVADQCGFRSPQRLRARCNSVLQGIDFKGARVLEVGCGKGMLGLWAALHGADYVLGIEPEGDGSDTGSLAEFRRTIDRLHLDGVVAARSSYLQDLKPTDGPFDVAILFNVINHLSERAVAKLHEDDAAVDDYVRILSNFRTVLADEATVVVADCGRRNFWNDVGLRSPLAGSIEWEKHQQPHVWESVFRKAGFEVVDRRWSTLYPLGWLSANWFVHYFSVSHFVLRFVRSGYRARPTIDS